MPRPLLTGVLTRQVEITGGAEAPNTLTPENRNHDRRPGSATRTPGDTTAGTHLYKGTLVSHIFRTTPATIGSQRGPVATAS